MKHLAPTEAHELLQSTPDAVLVDVRMAVEFDYVGHPPAAVNIPWYEFPDYKPQPAAFVERVRQATGGRTDSPVVLLCRSGLRTIDAGVALEKAGFSRVINVLDGFEGELDDNDQRGREGGWRFEGLPWVQS